MEAVGKLICWLLIEWLLVTEQNNAISNIVYF